MTSGVLRSIKRKNTLYKHYLTNPCKKNENKYKTYKNKLNHTIKISKKLYYEEQFIKYKHNSKMIWKTLNEILNKKIKIKELPKIFLDTDSSNEIKDPKIISIINLMNTLPSPSGGLWNSIGLRPREFHKPPSAFGDI